MSTWVDPVGDLRTQLSDGPTDRLRYRKRCIGEVDGINITFKTFEFRRVTNFKTTSATLGVWIDSELQPTSAIATDDPTTGQFTLVDAPDQGSVVEASYYLQWFTDTELTVFLNTASLWLLSSTNFSNIPGGLISAAIKYAAAEAYLKMATRWREYMSEIYKLEDAPNKAGTAPANEYAKMSETFRKEALAARDEFYTRQGRALQPLFSTVRGHVRNLP